MTPPTNSPQRRVALFVEASRIYVRGLVRGVARYNREHKQWSVYFTPQAPNDPPPAWLQDWTGDGVLARIHNRPLADALLKTGLPVIDLRRSVPDLGIPTIGPDDEAVARLVVNHLLQRGFRHFGFFGTPRGTHPSMDARAEHFPRFVAEAGFSCSELCLRHRRSSQEGWEKELDRVVRWLQKLPKPAGVMACNDDRGLQLLDACRRAGILVPDEIAVVGVGNDDCLCSLSLPSLTSVDLNPQRIGYEAARLLDEMMSQRVRTAPNLLIEPRGIVTRMSTDVLATEDQAVIRAVKFIRAHACQRIRVGDVLKHVRMSRGALEPRIKQVLGRTIYQEIQRVQIEAVKDLLLTTTAPLKQIAHQTGFSYPEYMMRVFRRATGQTPAEYRKTAQKV
jgi:LacI family transcriptional regulator